MQSKTILVFSREIKVMFRDRRLIVGVLLVSLVLMPFLMGFIGNIDRMLGSDDTPVGVLVFVEDDRVFALVQKIENVRIFGSDDLMHDLKDPYLTITKDENIFKIHGDGTDPRLSRVVQEIKQEFESWKETLVLERLAQAGLPRDALSPFAVEFVDTADEGNESALVLGLLVPYLVIILLVANAIRAIYVAVGEKQDNTLASLLVSSAPRRAIVLGKSFAIMTFSILSSVLLITGMVLFANLGFSIDSSVSDINFSLSIGQIIELLINIISVSLFVSSIIMFLGTYARSSREAGIYTSPLIYITIILAVFSISRSTFSTKVYLVPILGNVLAMKDSFLNSLSWLNLLLPVASNSLLFFLLLWGSVKLYNKESVLFRS
jgi:sodium transport system permease protein